MHRVEHQKRLREANPGWEGFGEGVGGSSRPDGDTELSKEVIQKVQLSGVMHTCTSSFTPSLTNALQFVMVDCHACGGVIKPNVVFFGGKVPDEVSSRATELVGECKALLVLGSSVATWSAYRCVQQ